jgi:uncharacterized protein (TIGR00255 family)
MKSMTGYGYWEQTDTGIFLSVEIKGYNSRFLEMTVNLSPQLGFLDLEIRRYMAERVRRGKLEITLICKERDSVRPVSVNREAVKAYQRALAEVSEILGLDEKPRLDLILGLEGVVEIEKVRQSGGYWQRLEPVLSAAADQFDAARSREGAHTEADIRSHLDGLAASAAVVAAYGPALESLIKENLKARFMELLGDSSQGLIDENRILAETAVLLMKHTISEELSRLGAHLTEFRGEIARNPSPGKKLDFLCQEINREINTIGSKTQILDVSMAVVDMKDRLENIREQLRNIE